MEEEDKLQTKSNPLASIVTVGELLNLATDERFDPLAPTTVSPLRATPSSTRLVCHLNPLRLTSNTIDSAFPLPWR